MHIYFFSFIITDFTETIHQIGCSICCPTESLREKFRTSVLINMKIMLINLEKLVHNEISVS